MATKPNKVNLAKNSIDILNYIRDNADDSYKDTIPVASEDVYTVREIGSLLVNHQPLRNQFVNLINRIGLTLVRSRVFHNPFEVFKYGYMELGETIQDIMVNICRVREFSEQDAYKNELALNPPEVAAAYHSINYRKQYYVSRSEQEFKLAFTTLTGVYDFISGIIQSIYNAVAYDEIQAMKYLICSSILNGRWKAVAFEDGTTPSEAVRMFREYSNNIGWPSSSYNEYGWPTQTPDDNKYIMLTSKYDALYDVEVLASAFNMDKAEFLGHKFVIDEFNNIDWDRMSVLFGDNITKFTPEQNELLNDIPAIIFDKDVFLIVDNLSEMREAFVNSGMYINSFYNCWRTFSVSPFFNAIVFTNKIAAIKNIKINGLESGQKITYTPYKGSDNTVLLTVTADFEGVVSHDFDFEISDTSTNVDGISILKIASTKCAINIPTSWIDSSSSAGKLIINITGEAGATATIEVDVAASK